MKVYFAAPLFNSLEREYNAHCAKVLEERGFEVFLPQRDTGELPSMELADRRLIRAADLNGLRNSDIVIAVLTGRALDEGTIYEIGFAEALGKVAFGICDDKRQSTNAMLSKVIVAETIEKVIAHIEKLCQSKGEWGKI